MTERQAMLLSAFNDADPYLELRRLVTDLVARGVAREQVLAELETLRSHLRVNGSEPDEDVVLDVMDALVGFTSPQSKI